MPDLTPNLAELRALAQRANDWGRWARWTDQDGAAHMRGLFMVGNLAAVIPIGEMWVETDPDDVNPIAECYTPELADFIAAANPVEVLALLDAAARLAEVEAERDALAAKVELVRALHYAADNDGARTPICETCHGKAGVHECGCWAERDREPVCGHCMDGWHGASVPWPCPTIRALDGEADR